MHKKFDDAGFREAIREAIREVLVAYHGGEALTAAACDPEALVDTTAVKAFFGGTSDMTLWRWRKAGILPDPIQIRGRNYWKRRTILDVIERQQSASGIAA